MSFTVTDAYHIVALVAMVLGFIAAYFGCRVFRLILALVGFVLSGGFGFILVYYFISPNLIAATIVGSVIAIAGSVVMAHFAVLGVFLIGSTFGIFLSMLLVSGLSNSYMKEDDTRVITMLGFAVMFGILGIHYRRIAIVGGTSMLGAYGLVSGLDHFIQTGFNLIIPKMANGHLSDISPHALFFIFIVLYVVVAGAGAFTQYKQMTKFNMKLYPGEEFEEYNNSSSSPTSFSSFIPPFLAKFLPLGRKKVADVPLLDVVALEDY